MSRLETEEVEGLARLTLRFFSGEGSHAATACRAVEPRLYQESGVVVYRGSEPADKA